MSKTTVVENKAVSLPDAMKILLGFVENHADKGDVAATAMVKMAKTALRAERTRSEEPVVPVVVIEMDDGLINVVESTHPVRIFVLDSDTEGGDESSIAAIDGVDVYLSVHGVDADAAVGTNDRAFNSTLAQIDAHLNVVEA